MRAVAVVLVLAVALPAARAVEKIYKVDQFSSTLEQAADEINKAGKVQAEPGFAQGEAFGVIYKPDPAEYPIKVLGIQLILGAAPNAKDLTTDADIEIWNDDGNAATPLDAEPMYKVNTKELFNQDTNEFGIPLKGNVGIAIDFNWDGEAKDHPSLIVNGNIRVMIRFTEPSADYTAEWDPKCAINPPFGCGCQKVAPLIDSAGTANANVMSILSEPMTCSGDPYWTYASAIGIKGDFVLRVRADVAEVACVPSCGAKQCGSDGCGGNCGVCTGAKICSAGTCIDNGCAPACTGKECGDDGCGGACGACGFNKICVQGACQDASTCTPKCDGKQCGDNGCGSVCGNCGAGLDCISGLCKPVGACTPSCTGKTCGDDTCGGVCGTCAGGQVCTAGVCAGGGPVSITDVSPRFGYDDEPTVIAIIGTGFLPGATAKIGGTSMSPVQVEGGSAITATVPKGLTPGKYTVLVINSDGTSGALTDAFEVKHRGDAPSDGCAAGHGSSTALGLLVALLAVVALRRRRTA